MVMINPNDPAEWVEQVKSVPESAPRIVKTLVSRLKSLDDINEELRNEIIELKEKIDTDAHRREVSELQRQLRALARIVRAQENSQSPEKALLIWSDSGYFSLISSTQLTQRRIQLPYPSFKSKLRLMAIEIQESILYVTSTGKSYTFDVKDLPLASPQVFKWHFLPEINLSSNEYISFILPISRLPLSDSLVTLSEAGYVRSIMRLSLDRLLQDGQIGRGVKQNQDSPAFATLVSEKRSEIILFTNRGNYARFSISNLMPAPTLAMKLSRNEEIVTIMSCDKSDQEILFVDSHGKVLISQLGYFSPSGLGLKPKSAVNTDILVKVSPVVDSGTIFFLARGEDALTIDTQQLDNIPRGGRTKQMVSLSDIEGSVIDSVCL